MFLSIASRSVDSWALAAASVAAEELQTIQRRAHAMERAAYVQMLADDLGTEDLVRHLVRVHDLTPLEEARIRVAWGLV